MLRIFSASFRQHSQAPASSEPRQELSLLSWELQGQGIYLAPILAAWRAASLTAPQSRPPQHRVGSRNTAVSSISSSQSVTHGANWRFGKCTGQCGAIHTHGICARSGKCSRSMAVLPPQLLSHTSAQATATV